jgi:hypothetical protein
VKAQINLWAPFSDRTCPGIKLRIKQRFWKRLKSRDGRDPNYEDVAEAIHSGPDPL